MNRIGRFPKLLWEPGVALASRLRSYAYVDLPGKWKIEKIHALTSIFSEYLRPDLEKNFDVAGNALAFKPNSRYLVGQGFVAYLKGKGGEK